MFQSSLRTGLKAKLDVPKATGRVRHTPGSMNKTEARYSEYLNLRKHAGEIVQWWFEPLKFRLGKSVSYTLDFEVLYPDGRVEFVDVKGRRKNSGLWEAFWEDDTRVKIKVVAHNHPEFDFVGVHELDGGEWKVERFGDTKGD